jgi:hypothetical protein
VHRDRVVLWRDTVLLAEHPRAPDGAHQRVVEPSHYALLFARKPRAHLMLYREALIQLGQSARWYMSERSSRQRARLREEVTDVYALFQQYGAERLLAVMAYATERSVYGAAYLRALLELPTWPPAFQAPLLPPRNQHGAPPPPRPPAAPGGDESPPAVPSQDEIDRALHLYEQYVRVDRGTQEHGTDGLAHAGHAAGHSPARLSGRLVVAERAG